MEQIDCLAFGPHPDDVELFCGGTLIKLRAQGWKTAITDLTEGELSTNGTIDSRREEATKATEILQLSSRNNLGIADGNIENNAENRVRVIETVRKLRPRICFVPYWTDRHPDHVAASFLIQDSLFYAGLPRVEAEGDAFRPDHVFFYMLHEEFHPSFVVDISDEMEGKMEAIGAYASQFDSGNNDTQQTYINNPGFLEGIRARAQYFGRLAGCRYAEPFFTKRMLKIDNLMDIFA